VGFERVPARLEHKRRALVGHDLVATVASDPHRHGPGGWALAVIKDIRLGYRVVAAVRNVRNEGAQCCTGPRWLPHCGAELHGVDATRVRLERRRVGTSGSVRIYLTARVRIEAGGRVIEGARFPGRLGRVAFAYLVAECDRPVTREELAEALWAGEPPRTWEKGTAVLVSKLRTLLAEICVDNGELISYAYGCYQLHLPSGSWVDTAAATQATAAAEAALAGGEDPTALRHAATAVELTHRDFLPGEDGAWVEGRRADLHRLRVRALDCLAEAQLRLGNPHAAVAAAKEAVSLEPYRESGYILLMRTHAAAGNRAEALRVHEECRRLLSEELGVDPSPETEAAHLELLRSVPRRVEPVETAAANGPDAAPDLAPAPAPRHASAAPPRRKGARMLVRAAPALALIAAATAIGIVLIGRNATSASPTVLPGIDTVARLSEQDNAFTLAARVGEEPTGVAITDQRIWVINYTSQTLSWLDPRSGAVLGTRSVGGTPTGIAASSDAIWVTAQFGLTNTTGGAVVRFDPTTAEPAGLIAVGDGVDGIAVGQGAVWVTNELTDTVLRIDAVTNTIGPPIPVGREPVAVAVGSNSVWVANELDSTVTRIDERTGAVTATIAVPTPSAIAASAGSVWVVSTVGGSVTRLDPTTNGVVTTISVGAGPTAAGIDGASVWVAVGGTGTVARIDAATNRVIASTRVRGHPDALTAGGGFVWLTVHA
jgi:SARP family transcriptional regulator, regulator of embCAB operon